MKSTCRAIAPWTLTAIVSLLAIYVWGHSLAWNFSDIGAYQFFPLLGLLGFSIMWSHYVIGGLRQNILKDVELRPYFRYTGYVVLLAIVLHPGILIYRRFRDGYGLPPHSYETYVAPGMGWLTLLGTVSLLIFLTFELHRLFAQKVWWKYVVGAGDAAMVAIFYHGLRLGSQLHGGWFQVIWWFYGVSLVGLILRKYVLLARGKTVNVTTTW